jgi:uncharacterized membrane protein YiaA
MGTQGSSTVGEEDVGTEVTALTMHYACNTFVLISVALFICGLFNDAVIIQTI